MIDYSDKKKIKIYLGNLMNTYSSLSNRYPQSKLDDEVNKVRRAYYKFEEGIYDEAVAIFKNLIGLIDYIRSVQTGSTEKATDHNMKEGIFRHIVYMTDPKEYREIIVSLLNYLENIKGQVLQENK